MADNSPHIKIRPRILTLARNDVILISDRFIDGIQFIINQCSGTTGGRRKSSVGSSVILSINTRSRRRRMSSGRTSSSADSLLTTSRSKSRSSAVSKGDIDTVKVHNEVIEHAK
jgi:hypothetical protein